MKKSILLIFLLPILSCWNKQSSIDKISLDSNSLENKTQTLQLEYVDFFCACPNWASLEDIQKYKDTGNLATHCVFIEPSDSTIKLPDTLGYSGDLIKFTGQFYKCKGYPKNYIIGEEKVSEAKIFRYTSYKVVRSTYQNLYNDSIHSK